MVNLAPSKTPALDKKGVPGFSERLDVLFDMAGAPSDTRLTWGAKRWSVVPNTVRNWIKLDTPPQNYSTLDFIVSDLLKMFNSTADKTAVIGWLFAGGTNPFAFDSISSDAINHMLQIKIFNCAFSICSELGFDINSVDEVKLNGLINGAYFKLKDMDEAGAISNIPLVLKELIPLHLTVANNRL